MKKNKRSALNTLMPLQTTAFKAGMKKTNKKTSPGLVGPKRKSAPKPIITSKVAVRKSSPSTNYSVSKKQAPGLSTGINGTRISTSAKRTISPSVAPSKFEQKKIKAMNKYQSKVAKRDIRKEKYKERQVKRAQSMRQREVIKNIRKTGRPEAPLQNGKELKPIMIKPNMGRIVKPMAKFPDLSGDGKVTKKDILMGRGVINKPKIQKTNAVIMKGVTAEDQPTDPLKDIQQKIVNLARTIRRSTDPNETNTAEELRKALITERDNLMHARKQDAKERGGARGIDALKAKAEKDLEKITSVRPSMKKNLKTNKTKTTMKKPKMTAKQKLAEAKKAKRAPGKAVRDARKGVRTENKNKRVAARATAKSARRATRATNLEGRITKKKARVTKRVNKTRATGKLSRLTAKPAMKKPKMSYKKKK